MTDQLLPTLVWAAIGFLSGSLMLGYWLGRWALKTDVRAVGDGNPGAANVMKAGGWKLGVLAVILDALKGTILVSIARCVVGLTGVPLVIVALSPIVGHAYSPFLGFRGGKAVAVSFGVWMALTLWEAPTFGGLLLGLWFSIVMASGWAVLLVIICLFAYYALTNPDPVILLVLALNGALLTWKYRADLRGAPGLRPWIRRWLPR